MHTIQVLNVTVEELVDRLKTASADIIAQPAQRSQPATINVLNKKYAAKMLGISETFFSKLQGRGIVPPTVNAGFNNKGDVIHRWAQHHIIAIKPVIMRLRHKQSEQAYMQAKHDVNKILGL